MKYYIKLDISGSTLDVAILFRHKLGEWQTTYDKESAKTFLSRESAQRFIDQSPINVGWPERVVDEDDIIIEEILTE